jgi:hypothetical protein
VPCKSTHFERVAVLNVVVFVVVVVVFVLLLVGGCAKVHGLVELLFFLRGYIETTTSPLPQLE